MTSEPYTEACVLELLTVRRKAVVTEVRLLATDTPKHQPATGATAPLHHASRNAERSLRG
jgi:hypothetical protein